jgi:hypothetical protein
MTKSATVTGRLAINRRKAPQRMSALGAFPKPLTDAGRPVKAVRKPHWADLNRAVVGDLFAWRDCIINHECSYGGAAVEPARGRRR